jgi:hypothetical protein
MVETIMTEKMIMKRAIMLAVFLFLLLDGSAAQPKLSLSSPDIDLGILYGSALKKGRLTLKNIGNQPLKIFSVQPGCGCTAVKKPKEVLEPNESDDIEIEFNATGYRGRVEKELFITSSDPTTQYIAVKILADVREELEPSNKASLVWLGNIPVGGTSSQTVWFRNTSGRTLTIKGVGSSVATVVPQLSKKSLAPNDSLSVTITVKAMRALYANERFWIEIESVNQPRVEMRVSYIGVAQ